MADFELVEQAPREHAIVRGDARSRVLAEAIDRVLGIALPAAPNTVAGGATHDALWLAPDEWLLVSKVEMGLCVRQDDAALERALRPLLAGEFATVVDVSSGYVGFTIQGARAREVLLKGCPLDMHPNVFGIGACAQSHYFKAPIVLRPLAEHAFEMIVRRSFAPYAARMLRGAADR